MATVWALPLRWSQVADLDSGKKRALKGDMIMGYTVNPDFTIADEQALRALFAPTHPLAALKSLPTLDAHARAFIHRAPFLCLGTQNREGRADVSPRGDPVGFVQVLDDHTLAIPDRPGNNRLDTLANILSNPNVGLLFLIPGFDDTLRVNGQATLVTDPDLLARMAVIDRVPKLAIVVKVSEVFLHCAKALRRSHLWDQSHLQNRADMPSLMRILHDQTSRTAADEDALRTMDADLEAGYKQTMY